MTGLLAVLNPVLAPAYRRRAVADADALAALVQAASSTSRSASPTSRA
jgi:hypothetical protein